MKQLISLLLIFITIESHAQRLIIFTSEKKPIILLDTTHLLQNKLYTVDTGMHILQTWLPTYKLMRDTIHVTPDTLIRFKHKFEHTPEFDKYKSELKTYNLKRRGTLYGTAAYTVLAVAAHFSFKSKMNDNLKSAQDEKANYELAISEGGINLHKSNYEEYKNEYDKYRKSDNILLIASAVIIPVGIYATYYYIRHTTKPEYHETPLLSHFDLNFINLDLRQPQATFTCRF